MAQQTKQQLIDRSEIVRIETVRKANTAERVGSLMKDMSENLVHTEEIPPITEEVDHLRTTKPIREAPYLLQDEYIKDSESATTNLDQFGISNDGQTVFITSIYIPITGTDISFNINNIRGSRQNPITSNVFTFSFTDALPETKCIVYSQRATKPTILNSAIIVERGDVYDTTGGINRLVFEYVDQECVVVTNTVVLASTIEVAPLYAGTGTHTATNTTTGEHTVNFANAVDGDLMIVAISRQSNTFTPPAGWDTLATVNTEGIIYTRKRTTGDSDTWIFINTTLTPESCGLVMPILRNVNYTNGNTSTVQIGTPSTSVIASTGSAPSITPTSISLVLAFVFTTSGVVPNEFLGWSSGWTLGEWRTEFYTSQQRLTSFAYKDSNGATGNADYTLNQSRLNTGILLGFKTV